MSKPKITISVSYITGFEQLLPPVKERILDTPEATNLLSLYNTLYPHVTIDHFSHFCFSSKRALYCEEIFGSMKSNSERSSIIAAYWPTTASGTIDDGKVLDIAIREVQTFLKHAISVVENGKKTQVTHYFAKFNGSFVTVVGIHMDLTVSFVILISKTFLNLHLFLWLLYIASVHMATTK